MAGYIGSKASVTQVDGYNRTEADDEFVNDPNSVISVSGSNVGIGTSSPSYGLHVANSIDAQAAGQFERTGGAVMRIQPEGLDAKFGTYSNTPLEFMTNSSERMRIDSSGNVHIGGTAENAGSSFSFMNGGGQSYLNFNMDGRDSYITGTNGAYIYSGQGSSGDTLAGDLILQSRSNESRNIKFVTGSTPAERMRLDGSGRLLVGTTDSIYAGFYGQMIHAVTDADNYAGIVANATRSAGNQAAIVCNVSGTSSSLIAFEYLESRKGSITTNGTSTSYNTTSDYRLKTDTQPMTGASARVQALNPVNFEWIASGERVDGFLAHEAQAVVPEAVTGTKDAMRDEEYEVTPAVLDEDGNVVTEAVMGTRSVPDYQGIDQSKLVPLLTAALQEALTKIDTMETRLAALEAV